jgi:hypothetical protein
MDFSTKYLWGITLFLVIHTILAQSKFPIIYKGRQFTR